MVPTETSGDEARTEGWRLDAIRRLPGQPVRWLFGLLLLYVVVRGLVSAATNPFFCDELLTMTVASQPGLKGIWGALAHGIDGQPPPFYLCERVAMGLVSNKQVALRFPSILGLVCTIVFVFVYVKRRSGELVAFLCALILMLTGFFRIYGVNARPYSLVMACIAFALICYQRLPSPAWTALLGISLTMAESFHYYAIFAMIPFGLAEVLVFFRTGRIRWSVWIALAFGTLPLIFCWPLLLYMRSFLGSHFWGHYSLSSLPKTYGVFFSTDGAYGGAIAAVLFAMIVGSYLFPRRTNFAKEEMLKHLQVEEVLILGLLGLPLIAFAMTKVTNGPMLDRYVLATEIGITIAVARALFLAGKRTVALFALFAFSSVGLHEISFWRSVHSLRLENPAAPVEEFMEKAGHEELPVVISDGVTYLQLAYYASAGFANRFISLADADLALEYLGTDTVDRGNLVLRQYMPIHVSSFAEFTSSHPEFLLYAEDPGAGFDWLPYRLSRAPWSLQVLAMEGNKRLYLVIKKEPAAR